MAAKASPSPVMVSCIRPHQEATGSAFSRHFLLPGVCSGGASARRWGGWSAVPFPERKGLALLVGRGGSLRRGGWWAMMVAARLGSVRCFGVLEVIPCSPSRGVPSLLKSGEWLRI